MRIGRHDLDERVLIVAEIGNNHEGRLEVARKLVETAAACGVDAVKFQTFRTELFVTRADPARYDRLRSFELPPAAFRELHDLARSLGLLFLSTALDLESVRVLESLVDAYKVASGDNDFFALLRAVCGTGKPLVVSSGMADLDHLKHVVGFVRKQWSEAGLDPGLVVLHCVTSYPAPPEQAHLKAIPLLARELRCVVGYSDHTLGIEACLAAAALGARLVEKHFTLDKNFSDFRDHKIAADPPEMKELVERLRRVETLLGQAEKAVQPCEEALIPIARRSIVAARDLPAGHLVSIDDLTWLRPRTGLPPGQEGLVVGRRTKRGVAMGEAILPSEVE